MDALVKIFDEFRSRIRSPIWGTIGLYVILLNWKAFYFLLFADVSVPEKFSFWDENVTHEWLIYYPLALGVGSVVIVPWIRLGLTWANRPADLKLHRLQATQKNDKIIHDLETETKLQDALAKEEAVREQQKIDRAKRLQEAGEVGGEELINEIKEDREADESTGYPELTEIEKWIVHILCAWNLKGIQLVLGNHPDVSKWLNDTLVGRDRSQKCLLVAFNRLTPKQNLELRSGLQNLAELGYFIAIEHGSWEVKFPIFDLWENYVSGEKIEHPVWSREETNAAMISPEV